MTPKENIPKLRFIQDRLFFKKTTSPNTKVEREVITAKIKFKGEVAKLIEPIL